MSSSLADNITDPYKMSTRVFQFSPLYISTILRVRIVWNWDQFNWSTYNNNYCKCLASCNLTIFNYGWKSVLRRINIRRAKWFLFKIKHNITFRWCFYFPVCKESAHFIGTQRSAEWRRRTLRGQSSLSEKKSNEVMQG